MSCRRCQFQSACEVCPKCDSWTDEDQKRFEADIGIPDRPTEQNRNDRTLEGVTFTVDLPVPIYNPILFEQTVRRVFAEYEAEQRTPRILRSFARVLGVACWCRRIENEGYMRRMLEETRW